MTSDGAVATIRDWWTRLQVTLALGRIKDPEGNRLQSIREAATAHLGKDPRVLEAIIDVIRDDADSMTRGGTAGMLEELADKLASDERKRAIDCLARSFRHDDDHFVRHSAAKSLRVLGWQSGEVAERATQAAMLEDLDALADLASGLHRDVAVAAAARELADGMTWRLIPFLREFGEGSREAVTGLERFMWDVHAMCARSEEARATVMDNWNVTAKDADEQALQAMVDVLMGAGGPVWEERKRDALEAIEALKPTLPNHE